MTRLRLIVLGCCVAFLGCGTTNPFSDQFRVPNLFATAFQNKEEVLKDIPVGTAMEKAQTVMLARGFEQWTRLSQDRQVTLVYHRFLGDLRGTGQDIWVTLYFREGAVVDVVVHR